jgi:hypothetical protein
MTEAVELFGGSSLMGGGSMLEDRLWGRGGGVYVGAFQQ